MKHRLRLRAMPKHGVYWMGGTPSSTTSEQTSRLDPTIAREIGPFADFTRETVNRPFQRYKGNLVAGFTPAQQEAFAIGRGGSAAQGQYKQLLASGPFQGGVSGDEQSAGQFLGSFYDGTQNPFFEQQLGIGRQRLGEQYSESIAPQMAGKYALSGAFGGTAQAEAEGIAQRQLGRSLGEYESGSRSAEQERRYAQGLQAAGQIEQTAGRRGQQSLQDAQLRGQFIGDQEGSFERDYQRLLGIGNQGQALRQRRLDSRYGQFQREQEYPERQFNIYRDAIAALTGGAPRSTSSSSQTSGGGPSDAQTAAGAATTAAALYAALSAAGAFCWVAREVYGEGNPQWTRFRYWMLTRAPAWFRTAYLRYGETWACVIRRHAWMKPFIRRWMDSRISTMQVKL